MTTKAAPEKRYTLTVTEGQARLIARAVSLLSRIHIGQLGEVGWEVERREHHILEASDTPEERVKKEMRWGRLRLLTTMLRSLNPLVTGHEHPGMFSEERNPVHDDAHAARDMERVIRHALWRTLPESERRNYCIDADAPNRTSKQPLATMEAAGEETNA